MPPKAKAAVKGGKPAKKEKVFHPDSRKAGQLARNALRKGKLGNLRTKRTKKASSMLELYAFFHAAVPPDGEALTLPELHTIAEAWVARNDAALAEEQGARRKGRPKSAREMRIEELKLREQETYRTGMELPDLTDAPTLKRFREWDVASIGYAHLLRFVRISSALPDVIVFSRAPTAGAEPAGEGEGEEEDDAPQLLDEMDET
ncbi:hypothetical protein B0H16DRAFT_574490 [Mycena metata]|uniref:Translation machinery-associated protein 16 n=1 Tax=Mycena metata TaxID=1033252 RepID=A0AAD7JAC6_9AGAR|nr:hypothetical protein B0H16DRAFT_574490 [Mycena metata]